MKKLLQINPRRLLVTLVIAPLLAYSIYLGVIAADRFVSESIVAVRQAGGEASALPGAAMMLAGITPSSHEDTLYLKDFVHSQGLLLTLDKRLDLRKHFGAQRADLPYLLSPEATREEFTAYYRNRVEVAFDDRSALLKIRTQGFDPAYAQQLNQAILEESERFVNETSHRIARERLRFAESELASTFTRLQQAKNQMLSFQSKHGLLDPTAQAQSTGALAMELRANRSRLETELNGLLAYLNEDAYQVQALRGRMAALDKQIASESQRSTSEDRRGERINALAAEFQSLQLHAQFTQEAYRLSLGAVENARIEATRKIKSLVVVEAPTLPESAEYPLRAYNLATLLTLCVLLFALTRLVLATIREHQD